MQSAEQDRLDAMETEASNHFELQEYDEAERLYGEILNTHLEHEGPQATYRDMFNLSVTLVKLQKHQESEPMLEQLLTYLTQRSGRESRHFIEQEAGTARLLGQGKHEQGRNMLDNASELDRRALNAVLNVA